MFRVFLKRAVLSAMVATAIVGCSDDDDNDNTDETVDNTVETTTVDGLATLASARPVDEAVSALRESLATNDAILVLPVIDHQANAPADLDLRATSVQLFGNPALGTPLMLVNQMAGLDLPQKMLAWEDEDGNTTLAYNSAEYLRQRHGLDGSNAADNSLETIASVLNAQAINASGNMEDSEGPAVPAVTAVEVGEGVLTVTSTVDMETTYSTLVSSIENNEALSILAEVDHEANAAALSGEGTLNPTRLVIFGNPNAGTPLMQAEQSIGIDLPQKMLVFEDAEGVVTIAYNDPVYLANRHGITGQDDRLMAISGALSTLANNAAGVVLPE